MDNNFQASKTASDGLYFLAIMLKYKVFIIVMTIISAVASILIALFMPIWYASTVSFVPPQESVSGSSGGGELGAIMKDFGLAKVGGTSMEYTMLVFFESRSVADSIIRKYDMASVYGMKNSVFSDVRMAFKSNVAVEYWDEGNYEITVWDQDKERAANIANDYVQVANYYAQKIHKDELAVNIGYLNDRIKSIDSSINATSLELNELVKDKNIFSPEEQIKAASVAIGALKEAEIQQEIVYDIYKESYGEEDTRTINAREMYLTTQRKVKDAFSKPGLVGNFALKDAAPITMDYITKYVDIEAFTKVKTYLATSLEKATLDNQVSTPNFFVVDEAIPADKKDKPKRSFVVAGGIFGGFALSIFIVLLVNGFKLALRQSKQLLNEPNNNIS